MESEADQQVLWVYLQKLVVHLGISVTEFFYISRIICLINSNWYLAHSICSPVCTLYILYAFSQVRNSSKTKISSYTILLIYGHNLQDLITRLFYQ